MNSGSLRSSSSEQASGVAGAETASSGIGAIALVSVVGCVTAQPLGLVEIWSFRHEVRWIMSSGAGTYEKVVHR